MEGGLVAKTVVWKLWCLSVCSLSPLTVINIGAAFILLEMVLVLVLPFILLKGDYLVVFVPQQYFLLRGVESY